MSPIEVAWTIVTALGVAFHVKGLSAALQDRAAVIARRSNGYRQRIATGRVRAEATRLAVQVLLLTAGVISLLNLAFGWLFAVIFMSAAVILVLDAFLASRSRASLLRDLVDEFDDDR